nr:autotransporter-associated beta strand repeat-containing protein [Pirellula staleyi]
MSPAVRRLSPRVRRRMFLEGLEERRVLTSDVTLDGLGALSITDQSGTDDSYTLELVSGGTMLQITSTSLLNPTLQMGWTFNGTNQVGIPVSTINLVTLSAGAGDDSVELDTSLSTLIGVPIVVHGDAGASDQITVESGATLTANADHSADLVLQAGATALLTANATFDSLAGTGGNVNLGSFTFTSGGDATSTSYAGTISGTGVLLKTGAGMLTMSGDNSAYLGTTTINHGTIVLGHVNALGSTAARTITLNDASTPDANPTALLASVGGTISNNIVVGAGMSGGNVTTIGTTNIPAPLTTFSGTIAAAKSVDLVGENVAGTIFSGAISGNLATLEKTGSQGVTISGSNTFTGSVDIASGVLTVTGGSAVPNTSQVNVNGVGATLTVATSEQVGNVTGVDNSLMVLATGATLTTGVNTPDAVFHGDISGDGNLTKLGSNTFALTGSNSYTGTTTVSAGTLEVRGGSLTGNSILRVGGGTFRVTQNGTVSAGTLGNDAGTGSVNIDVGSVTIASGLSVDNLRVGFNDASSGTGTGSLLVNGGAVSIGAGASTNFFIGRSSGGTSVDGTVNLTAASSVTISVASMALGVVTGAAGDGTSGTLLLPDNVTKNITATTSVLLGDSATPFNNAEQNLLSLGAGTTTINTPVMTVGGRKANGQVTIGAGGTLNLYGAGGAATVADLFLADNNVGTGSVISGVMNLAGATFNANLDELRIARHFNGTGASQASLTFGNGTVNAVTLAIANPNSSASTTTQSTAPTNTTGSLVMNGGSLNVTGTTVVGLNGGLGTLDVNGGTVTLGSGSGSNLYIGRRTGDFGTGTGVAFAQTVDFTGATSVSINVAELGIVTSTSATGSNQLYPQATVTLSASNNITASTSIVISNSTTVGLAGTNNLRLGASNTINTPLFVVAGDKGSAQVSFVASGSTLNLGTSGNRTELRLGAHATSASGTSVNGTFLATGSTLNAFLSSLIVGSKPNVSTGTVAGTFTMNLGTVDTNNVVIARRTDAGTAGTVNGTLNLNGGSLLVNSTLADGGGNNPTLNISGGTLRATTIDRSSATPFNINFASGTIQNPASGNTTVTDAVVTTTGSGPRSIVVDASQSITFQSASQLAGTGTGAITKSGDGTLILEGASTNSAGFSIADGTLLANNSSGSATGSGAVSVLSGSILAGTGTITGAVTVAAGGVLGVGLTLAGTESLATGAALLQDDATLDINLSGVPAPVAGTDYDQLIVPGLTLGSAGQRPVLNVNLTGTITPATLQSFLIISNTGGAAVSGVFRDPTNTFDLAEGSEFVVGGQKLYISYTGGDGNDVVLYSQPVINGTAGADTVVVTPQAGGNLEVVVGSSPAIILVNPPNFTFNGLAGDDRLIVTANSHALPSGGLFFNGGTQDVAGPFGDVLRVNGDNVQSAIYTPDAVASGALDNDGRVEIVGRGVINFTQLEPVDIHSMASVTLSTAAANDIVTLSSGTDSATGTIPAIVLTGSSGGVPFEQLHVWNVGTLTVDTTLVDGNDTVTVSTGTATTHNVVNLQIENGAAGTDTTTVSTASTFTGNVLIHSQTIAVNATLTASAAGNVTLDARGSITTSGTGVDIVTQDLIASATTGINLDTTVATIVATNSTSGSITIDETNAVTLTNVTNNNAPITINTTSSGNVAAANVNAGSGTVTMTINNGNLDSAAGDAGVADIVAGTLNVTLSTTNRSIGGVGNRLEVNLGTLVVATNTTLANFVYVVDTAGGLSVSNSTVGAGTGATFDVLALNGSIVGDGGTDRDIGGTIIVLEVTGSGSTIGTLATPFRINAPSAIAGARVDATTAGGVSDHISLLDNTDNFPIGVINAGLGDIRLESTGAIHDNAADTTLDILGDQLEIVASSGIGVGGSGALETQVNNLEARSSTGGILVTNTGDLTIGGASGGTVGARTTTSGGVNITSTGNMSVTEGILSSGGGNVTLSSGGTFLSSAAISSAGLFTGSSAGSFTANSTITSVGNLTATAGGDMTINANLTASGGASSVLLTTTDSAASQNFLLEGSTLATISAGTSITINAGDNATLEAGSRLAAGTTVSVTIDAASADGGGAVLSFAGDIDAVSATFTGGAEIDTFNVRPDQDNGLASTPISIFGGDPTMPAGDVLVLDITGLGVPTLTLGAVDYSGVWSFGTSAAGVAYTSIETVQTTPLTSVYNLVLDMRIAGFQNGAADAIEIFLSAPNVFEVEVNGLGKFSGQADTINSFTVIGSDDSESLTIRETAAGLPSFDGAAPLVDNSLASGGVSNGAHLNTAADAYYTASNLTDVTIHFDGGLGDNSLALELLTAADVGYFSDVLDGQGSGNVGVGPSGAPLTLVSFADLDTLILDGAGGNLVVDASSSTSTADIEISDDALLGDGVTEITADTGLVATTTFEGFLALDLIAGGGNEAIDLINIDSTSSLTSIDIVAGSSLAATDNSAHTVRIHAIKSGVPVTVTGDIGVDTFQVFDSGNSASNIASTLSFNGVAGDDDALIVDDSGSPSADSVVITRTTIEGLTIASGIDITFTSIDDLDVTTSGGADTIRVNMTEAANDLDTAVVTGAGDSDQFYVNAADLLARLTLNGGLGDDTFGGTPSSTAPGYLLSASELDGVDDMIRPSLTTPFFINGNDPTVLPGDVLNIDVSALGGGLAATSPVLVSSGQVLSSTHATVTFTTIEDLNLADDGEMTSATINDIYIRGTNGNDTIQFARANTTLEPNRTRVQIGSSYTYHNVPGKTLVYGRGGNDIINQSNLQIPAEFYGEAGDDFLTGSFNNDLLVGGLGNDRINASSGNNIVWGDDAPTSDELNPHELNIGGNDTLSALGGNDIFYAGGGNDSVSPGAGDDWIHGGYGNDQLSGSSGNDRIYGAQGNDTISGDVGDDFLSGGDGDDRLYGRDGNDVLIGGDGVDLVDGGNGNDLVLAAITTYQGTSDTATSNTYNSAVDAAMLALLVAWNSGGPVAANLTHTDDFDRDTLYGGSGNDLFGTHTNADPLTSDIRGDFNNSQDTSL